MSDKKLQDHFQPDAYALMESQVGEMKNAGFLDQLEIGMIRPNTLSPEMQTKMAEMVERITDALERKNLYKTIERQKGIYSKEVWGELESYSIEQIKQKIRSNATLVGFFNDITSGIISFEKFRVYMEGLTGSGVNIGDNPVGLLMIGVYKTKKSGYDFLNSTFNGNLNPKSMVTLIGFPHSGDKQEISVEIVSLIDMIVKNMLYMTISYVNNQMLLTDIPASKLN